MMLMRTVLFSLVISLAAACSGAESGTPDAEPGLDAGPGDASQGMRDASSVTDAAGDGGASDRGPAYAAGTAACPVDDGVRRIKLVNNCTQERWFKLDGRTTPLWARPTDCAWRGQACTDVEGVAQCNAIAADMSGGVATGNVYCKANEGGEGASCACNPFFRLGPGEEHEIEMPAGAAFESGTGWLATGCNPLGSECELGDEAATNSTFEFTYDRPGSGQLWYDVSAVNAWTSASAVGMRSCGGGAEAIQDPDNVFWCRGAGCRFDVETQCPDGSDAFAAAAGDCGECPTRMEGGSLVIAGSCGTCPDGSSSNLVPTGVLFNATAAESVRWTWSGSPDFARGWGSSQGERTNRRASCSDTGCSVADVGASANTCLGGCDLCTLTTGMSAGSDACLKYCCPDGVHSYGGHDYRYDSQGCTAIGVQGGTDYTVALKAECPYVYTFGYEDHSSTFRCTTAASLIVQSCPDGTDFPASW